MAGAGIEGAEVPADLIESLVWRFPGGSGDWRPLPALGPRSEPTRVAPGEDGLRVTLDEAAVDPTGGVFGGFYGGLYAERPDWDPTDWSHVLVEARSDGPVAWVGVSYGLRREAGATPWEQLPLRHFGDGTLVIADGVWRTYRIDARPQEMPNEAVAEIGIEVGATAPATLEIRSITWVPEDAHYADGGYGVRSVELADEAAFWPRRRTLFADAPARFVYRVRVPTDGRLGVGLAAHGGDTRFAVTVEATGEQVGNLEILDGRWGASLELPEVPRLLLYDLWEDPFALARRFQPGEGGDLSPEQLESLRALGYVQ